MASHTEAELEAMGAHKRQELSFAHVSDLGLRAGKRMRACAIAARLGGRKCVRCNAILFDRDYDTKKCPICAKKSHVSRDRSRQRRKLSTAGKHHGADSRGKLIKTLKKEIQQDADDAELWEAENLYDYFLFVATGFKRKYERECVSESSSSSDMVRTRQLLYLFSPLAYLYCQFAHIAPLHPL